MERPTDSYKETHNLTLAEADKLFGGQVSNLQVLDFELQTTMTKNKSELMFLMLMLQLIIESGGWAYSKHKQIRINISHTHAPIDNWIRWLSL